MASASDLVMLRPMQSGLTVQSKTTTDLTPEITGTTNDFVTAINVNIDGSDYAATNNGDGTWTLADDTITPDLPLGANTVIVTQGLQTARGTIITVEEDANLGCYAPDGAIDSYGFGTCCYAYPIDTAPAYAVGATGGADAYGNLDGDSYKSID